MGITDELAKDRNRAAAFKALGNAAMAAEDTDMAKALGELR